MPNFGKRDKPLFKSGIVFLFLNICITNVILLLQPILFKTLFIFPCCSLRLNSLKKSSMFSKNEDNKKVQNNCEFYSLFHYIKNRNGNYYCINGNFNYSTTFIILIFMLFFGSLQKSKIEKYHSK